MAYDHSSVITAQYEKIAAERAQALGDYEAGRLAEDEYETMSAADRIVESDAKLAALEKIANNYVASQQQPPPQGNKYGLSDDEVAIAKSIAGSDRTLDDEGRMRVYAEQKERLRYLRQTGQYRDDQGSIRR